MSAPDDDGEPTRGVVQAEVTDRAIRAALAEKVRHLLPARVTKFDAATQKADVKILVGDFGRDETGALVTRSVPIITSVPVMFLTAGGFTFTVPIQAGDDGTTGALFFSDRSLDRWLSGSGQEVVDPEIYVRHALSDGLFIPGLLTFAKPMSSAPPTDHATAGSIAGKRIHFRDSIICVGDESGSDFVALGDKTKTEIKKVLTYAQGIASAIQGGVPVPMDGGSALQTSIVAAIPLAPTINAPAADQAKGH